MGWNRLLTDLGLRAEPRISKFVAFFQLVDACAHPGCPVCRALRELTSRTLDGLLYEQVTDPATRAELNRSWGFCNWHAWMSRDVRNAGLGIGIIYEDLLGQLGTRLKATRRELSASPVRRGWRWLVRRAEPVGLVRARAQRARCSLCAMLGHSEASYLRVVLDYVEDPEFDRAYARSAGLCLPHLTLALAEFPAHRGAAPLLTRTMAKLDALAAQLRSFIDKHDYRKQAPFTDAEATSWTDAVAFLVGQREVFGNEIPRSDVTGDARPEPSGSPSAEPARAETRENPRERLDAAALEKERLELRRRELMQQLGDESSRAAALHYRLHVTDRDRNVLELNLAGERAAARTWESMVQELRAEIADLKRRLAKYEPPPDDTP